MRKSDAAAMLLFLLLAVMMTWPLAPNINRAVSDPGDPYINTWILDWVSHALLHAPTKLFHANAFYPARYSLAFSENLILVGAALTPLRLAGVQPIAAHNAAMLFGFASSGFAAFLLARFLTRSTTAALAAGIFYAFLPFRFTHLPHVQHAFAGWLPLLLLALLHYVAKPDRRRAAWFAAALVGTALTNVHWFFFGAFAAGATILLTAAGGERRWRPIVIATVAAAVVIAPFFYPYFAVAKLYGMERTWSEVAQHSAQLGDWLAAGFHSRTYTHFRDPHIDPERWLFPGILGIAFSVAGVVAARRQRYVLAVALLWIFIGVYGSLGTNGAFHTFLFDAVPGFRAIRSPARWAAVAYCGMAVLVAYAVAALDRRSTFAAALVSLAFLIELRAAPIRWYMAPTRVPAVYRWLAGAKDVHAVLELPMDVSSEYRYLLRSTAHHRNLVNGISGFAPPASVEIGALANSDPIPESLIDKLVSIGCDRIIVHVDALGARHEATRSFIERATASGRLVLERRFDAGLGGDSVFRITADAPRRADTSAFELRPASSAFGHVDSPAPGAVIPGAATFSGFAFAPRGIRSATFVLDNGAVRIPARLVSDPPLSRLFPWYPATPRPRFVANIPARPAGVEEDTDVYVEIVDGAGNVSMVDESRWFTWR